MVDIIIVISYPLSVAMANTLDRINTLDRNLARLIRQSRDSAGMLQQELADKVGVTRASISNIERNKQALSVGLFYKLAIALREDPSVLLKNAIQSIKDDVIVEHEAVKPNVAKVIHKYINE